MRLWWLRTGVRSNIFDDSKPFHKKKNYNVLIVIHNENNIHGPMYLTKLLVSFVDFMYNTENHVFYSIVKTKGRIT